MTVGRTAVVIPVPAADPLLMSVARRFPDAVRDGVPAHVSLLYPFLAGDMIDTGAVATLRAVFATQPALSVTFDECRRHGGFVYLHPNPRSRLGELTQALQRHWPQLVPYEGRRDVVAPHVSVAMRLARHSAAGLVQELTRQLPFTARLDQAWLVAFDGRWNLRDRFPFAG